MTTSKLEIKENDSGVIARIDYKLYVDVKKKDRNWIIYSPDLNTFGYSDISEKKAEENFYKAIKIFFYIQTKRNSLKRFLLNHGWHNSDHKFEGISRFKNPRLSPKSIEESFALAATN